jgi:intracellular sulfur oxidation DsrE/DsrF family protein
MPNMSWLMRLCVLTLLVAVLPARAAQPDAGRVVYHLSDANPAQAQRALGFIHNHIASEPGTRIVVLAHAAGIDFLLQGASMPNGVEFAPVIHELAARGVEFRVCNLTLLSRKIDPALVHPDARIVGSGVVELTRLQSREGYAYIRP